MAGGVTFGPFEFDADRGLLVARDIPVPLGARGVPLLSKLIAASGKVVSRNELMDAAWPGTVVEESNLTVQIAALRKCLKDAGGDEDWIATVPRVGYRFVGRIDLRPNGTEIGALKGSEAIQADPSISIAVLPFRNLSGDADQIFFVEGLSEDLITDLSKVPGTTVIARSSSFTFRDKTVDSRAIAADLGVRFLVEGSVRRIGNRVRVNAQLTQASNAIQVWAERFDRDIGDVFALQDELAAQIVAALSEVLPGARVVSISRASSVDAYDLFVRGRALVMQSVTDNRTARGLLQTAIEKDPGFAAAHAWLAMSHCAAWALWGGGVERDVRGPALALAQRAFHLDPGNAEAKMILGHIHAYAGDLDAAIIEFGEALRLNPNLADAWALSSDLHVFRGDADKAIASMETAFRLNPYPPRMYHWTLGFALYAMGRYEEAALVLRHPATYGTGSQRILAASLAQMGHLDEAKAEASRFLTNNPGFNIRTWIDAHPFRNPRDRDHFTEGYLKAGLPEQ